MPADPFSQWCVWTAVLCVIAAVCALVHAAHSRRRLARIRQEREAIEKEERRMFDFLHGLGENLQSLATARNMHRLVVNGVVKVVGARGGILYLRDKQTGGVSPAYVSTGCPPLVPLPEHARKLFNRNPRALRGHQQLRQIAEDNPVLARVLASRAAFREADFPGMLEPGPGETPPRRAPVMGGPMFLSGELLGMLVVAREAGSPPFSDNDFSVFQSVTEQSGFALVNSTIHRDAAEKQALERELQTASEIQRILFPDEDPEVPGYRVRGTNRPAHIVSGDYFDYLDAAPGKTGVAIADVSGKGVAASLLSAMCRSVLRTVAPGNLSPADALGRLNELLYEDIREDMFISMAYLLLDHASTQITLARAGHDAPLVFRAASGEVERLTCPGLALGIDEGAVFRRVTRDFTFHLDPGDILLLYTDGVNEALDIEGDEFGMDRLKAVIAQSAPKGPAALVDHLIASVREFVGDHPQSDDITLIAIQRE